MLFDIGVCLVEVGRWGGLSDCEMQMDVDLNYLVDFVIKFLEMVSRKVVRKVYQNICYELDFIIVFIFLVD